MGRILVLGTLAVILLGASRPATGTTYVFSTFKGDDAAGMKLSIYTSTDSINFTLLSDTGFGGNTTYLRDPSIMKYTDGKYYLAYTDPTTASCCNPEDHFGIAVSSDLIHWTDLTTVKAGVPAVSRTWAPEWFIDGGVVRIVANIDTGNKLPNFQPYVFTAQDSALTSWSGPTPLGIQGDYIDTTVAKLGSTYHAFVKSELTRYLEHATAPSLTGPWTFVGTGDWAKWGSGLEGPTIVQMDDGKYKMYVDPQSGGTPCQYMTSADLNTWSARASIPGAAGTAIRHGTVIRDMTGHGSNGNFAGTGGATGTGGGAGSPGQGTGGAAGNGAATDAGMATGVDGSRDSGGVTGTGGNASTGGQPGTGGTTSVGGATGAGGATGTGAAAATGGSASVGTATGGSTSAATGGSTNSGGSPGSGGTAGSSTTPGVVPADGAASGCSCELAAGNSGQRDRYGLILFAVTLTGWQWLRGRRRRRGVTQASQPRAL
jgi:hypothetical protein